MTEGMDDLTDEQADALLSALAAEGFTLPFMARAADHPDAASLRAADAETDADNRAALRRAFVAGVAGNQGEQ